MSGALRDLFAERIYNAIGGEQADRILGMFDWAVQDAAAAAAREPVAPAEAEMAWDALWRDIDLHYPKYKTLVSIKQKHRPAIEAAIRGATPAPASTETEWDALIAECHTGAAARAAIYTHRDRIEAAIRGTTPLDAERLAEAIHNYGGVCAKRYGHINCTGPDHLHMAEKIAAEYVALRGQPSEPEA